MTLDHIQTNITIRYKLILLKDWDVDPTAQQFPARDTWEMAAEDAVQAGVATWENAHCLKIDEARARIERVMP